MRPEETVSERTSHWPHHRFRLIVHGSDRKRRSAPAGLLGMLVLVAVVEALIEGAGGRFIDPVRFGWRYSFQAARERAPGCDVLFLGDSLVKHGLSPRVIREVTGRRTYNIASPGSPLPMTYALLRRAIDAGARPSAIVFDIKPSLQVGGPEYFTRNYAEVLGPREAIELGLAARSAWVTTDILLGSLFPSYRCRRDIRTEVFAALRGGEGPNRALNEVCQRNWTVNDGLNTATPSPNYDGAVTEPEHWHLISRGFYAHRVHAEYARRLLTLANDRKIRAYLLLPPFVRLLDERRRQTGAEAKYEAFVKGLQDKFPSLTVLDARASNYPPGVFIDPIHLDFRGMLALSADVAAVLRDDFGRAGEGPTPKRWLALPAYRERPRPVDLEDVELSRARLKETTAR